MDINLYSTTEEKLAYEAGYEDAQGATVKDIYNDIWTYLQRLQSLGRADFAVYYYQGKEDAVVDILKIVEQYFREPEGK